jgi:hypothetical protein
MSKLYLVVRRTWFNAGRGYLDLDDDAGGTPLAGFRRKADANALCKRLEREAREEVAASPFRLFEDFDRHTTLAEAEFVDAVEKLRLMPPGLDDSRGYDRRDWVGWYDSLAPSLTARQRQGLWKLFDRVKCYEVIAVDLDEAAS